MGGEGFSQAGKAKKLVNFRGRIHPKAGDGERIDSKEVSSLLGQIPGYPSGSGLHRPTWRIWRCHAHIALSLHTKKSNWKSLHREVTSQPAFQKLAPCMGGESNISFQEDFQCHSLRQRNRENPCEDFYTQEPILKMLQLGGEVTVFSQWNK